MENVSSKGINMPSTPFAIRMCATSQCVPQIPAHVANYDVIKSTKSFKEAVCADLNQEISHIIIMNRWSNYKQAAVLHQDTHHNKTERPCVTARLCFELNANLGVLTCSQ